MTRVWESLKTQHTELGVTHGTPNPVLVYPAHLPLICCWTLAPSLSSFSLLFRLCSLSRYVFITSLLPFDLNLFTPPLCRWLVVTSQCGGGVGIEAKQSFCTWHSIRCYHWTWEGEWLRGFAVVGLFVCMREVCMYAIELSRVCLHACLLHCVFLGFQLSGLCPASIALEQTLEAVVPVQGRMRKGRGGVGCTVGKGEGGGWRR